MTDLSTRPQRARRIATSAPSAPEVVDAAPVANGNGHDVAVVRPVRKPFGMRRQRLQNPPIPGFQCRWINDRPGRIDYAKECGWEHVLDSEGRPVKSVVGVAEGGGGLIAYRMKVPLEWYEEDQAAKEVPRAALDAQMRRSDKETGYVSTKPPGFTETRVVAGMSADGRQTFGTRTAPPSPQE
jgi:hypothetical protein